MTLRLFLYPTLNAFKAMIALEEMGLSYRTELVDILHGGQDDPAFRRINPNGRIPALTDELPDGQVVTVFESAAILQYLGRKTGLLYPADEPGRAQVDSWLFWQMAGLGPSSGNLNWFSRAAAKPGRDATETSLAIHRFRRETGRLFEVLDGVLQEREFLCFDYSIADICCWTWIDRYPDNGGGLTGRPALRDWHQRIAARPAVRQAMADGARIAASLAAEV